VILVYVPFLRENKQANEIAMVPMCLPLQLLITLTDFYESGLSIIPTETKPKPVFSVNTIWQAREIVKWEENIVGCVQEDPTWSPLQPIFIFREIQTLQCQCFIYRRSRLLGLLTVGDGE
jgi:hypothetical protein